MLARALSLFNFNNSGIPHKVNLPDRAWLDAADTMMSYTPDIVDLEQNLGHWLFVYDNTMRGYTEHHLLRDAEEHGTAFTAQRFALWQSNRGRFTFPIALRSNSPYATLSWHSNHNAVVPTARIRGLLYFVPPPVIINLDKERHNGVLFHRERVDVSVPYHRSDEHPRDAKEYIGNVPSWMYIGAEDYWSTLLDGGLHFSPADLRRPRPTQWLNEHFYTFEKPPV